MLSLYLNLHDNKMIEIFLMYKLNFNFANLKIFRDKFNKKQIPAFI